LQIVAAAIRKEQEPKVRLVQKTCNRLAEKEDLRTREGDETGKVGNIIIYYTSVQKDGEHKSCTLKNFRHK